MIQNVSRDWLCPLNIFKEILKWLNKEPSTTRGQNSYLPDFYFHDKDSTTKNEVLLRLILVGNIQSFYAFPDSCKILTFIVLKEVISRAMPWQLKSLRAFMSIMYILWVGNCWRNWPWYRSKHWDWSLCILLWMRFERSCEKNGTSENRTRSYQTEYHQLSHWKLLNYILICCIQPFAWFVNCFMGFDSFDSTRNILNFINVPVTLKISRFDVDRIETFLDLSPTIWGLWLNPRKTRNGIKIKIIR